MTPQLAFLIRFSTASLGLLLLGVLSVYVRIHLKVKHRMPPARHMLLLTSYGLSIGISVFIVASRLVFNIAGQILPFPWFEVFLDIAFLFGFASAERFLKRDDHIRELFFTYLADRKKKRAKA